MEHDEEMLVSQAASMGFDDFNRALNYWKQLADPEGADDEDEARRASRNVYLEPSFSGVWLGQMTLDPISGSIVSGELNRLEHTLFETDCAEAAERLGRRPRLDELERDTGQRRADALVEMATRSASAPADGIRPAPLFSVFVGYETIQGRICELENGTVLAPSALEPWMDSAYFERAIFSLGGRVDVSVRARLFTGGTRRAIELRDRICTHPYCYEPAETCEADHIEPYAEGGPTTQENGRLPLRLPQPAAYPAPAPSAGGGLRPGRASAHPPFSLRHFRFTAHAQPGVFWAVGDCWRPPGDDRRPPPPTSISTPLRTSAPTGVPRPSPTRLAWCASPSLSRVPGRSCGPCSRPGSPSRWCSPTGPAPRWAWPRTTASPPSSSTAGLRGLRAGLRP